MRKANTGQCRAVHHARANFEEKVLSSTEKMRSLEHTIYVELRNRLTKSVKQIQDCAYRVAIIDVLSTFAEIAVQYRYTRPVVNDSHETGYKSR